MGRKRKIKKNKLKKDINTIMKTIEILIKEKLESQKKKGKWILNQWVKKAVLLSFQVTNKNLYLMTRKIILVG